MAFATELPPLAFDNDDLPIFLVPPSDDSPATDSPAPAAAPETQSESRGQQTDLEPGESASSSSHRLTVPPRDQMRLRKKREEAAARPEAPTHPVPSMQAAFAESLMEVTIGTAADKPRLREFDAKGRHDRLIEQEKDAEVPFMSWRRRGRQQEHELWKLMAQISFGVYLLMNGMANSNEQVVTILQGHIDEVDEFLEVLMEDFEFVSKDLQERIDHLKLPTENIEVFETMLEDRGFRVEVVQGNERIEHVLARTTALLKQYEKDIEEGLKSTQQFAVYLAHENFPTEEEQPEVAQIYQAMKGNTDGWFQAFKDLQVSGKKVNALISQLTAMVASVNKKAGEVSRRTWASIPPFTAPSTSSPSSSPPPIPSSTRSSPSRHSPPSTLRSVASLKEEVDMETPPLEAISPEAISPALQDEEGSEASTPRLLVDTGSTTPEMNMDKDERPVVHSDPDSEKDSDGEPEVDEEPLYILQPRTYTPLPPEPLPSPMVRDPPVTFLSIEPEENQQRLSLRQRVSLKTSPPDAIQIPDRREARRIARQAHDSAYESGIDQRLRSSDSTGEFSPPIRPTVVVPSPRSDQQQFYRPVQASPHSPLMQRPQTAGAAMARASRSPSASEPMPAAAPGTFYPHHVRQQPSRMGGASMLSTVMTTASRDGARPRASVAASDERTLRKKKSAFGWLKKAFSLDDDERAAYEALKTAEVDNVYFGAKSQKYLDGKRIQ